MRGCFEVKNQKNRENVMNTTTTVKQKTNLFDIVFILVGFMIVVFGLATSDFFLNNRNVRDTKPAVFKSVDPAISLQVENLQKNVGSIAEQRQGIEILSKALKDGSVTSKALGQKGNWLGIFRDKVAVREAVIAWGQIQEKANRAKDLDAQEISEAEKAAKIVSRQIESPYALAEGLNIRHGDLWRTMYKIRTGKNPD